MQCGKIQVNFIKFIVTYRLVDQIELDSTGNVTKLTTTLLRPILRITVILFPVRCFNCLEVVLWIYFYIFMFELRFVGIRSLNVVLLIQLMFRHVKKHTSVTQIVTLWCNIWAKAIGKIRKTRFSD